MFVAPLVSFWSTQHLKKIGDAMNAKDLAGLMGGWILSTIFAPIYLAANVIVEIRQGVLCTEGALIASMLVVSVIAGFTIDPSFRHKPGSWSLDLSEYAHLVWMLSILYLYAYPALHRRYEWFR